MAADAPRLALWVQHLLGIGHVARAAALTRAAAAAGWQVEFITGGPPLDGLDTGPAARHQLEPLRSADATLSRLVDANGAPADAALFARRRGQLVDIVQRSRPDILMVEHFPFGRRAFRGELTAAIEAARGAGAKIACSVRDILVSRKAERAREAASLIQDVFDLVLVHGDERLIGLSETFPLADEIAEKLRYTGYIGGAPVARGQTGDDGWDEIVVSAGGGAVGRRIVETAIEAAGRCAGAGSPCRILIGQATPQEDFEQARKKAPAAATVERARPDFRQLLANAAVSVSQAGYNTVVDVLQAGVPSVMVPFAGGDETEQTLRADKLTALGRVQTVAEEQLEADTLGEALRAARTRPLPALDIALDGERTTERLLRELAESR